MKYKEIAIQLRRVQNTLRATKLRTDEIEAAMRINACSEELEKAIEVLENDHNDGQGENVCGEMGVGSDGRREIDAGA